MLARISRTWNSLVSSVYWRTTMGKWGVNGVFNALYEGQPASETFRNIYRDVFGPEFAEEADPCGFLTMTDLNNLVRDLRVGPGKTFADLACGRGGGGLWVARATGASLVGLDISDVAAAQGAARIGSFGLEGRAQFRAADIAATGFPDASFDGAMSIDSLFLVPDKVGAFREAGRILKPGARFCFTTWEVDEPNRVKDYRPLLERFDFAVETYEESPDWRRRQQGVHERILAEKDQIISEMGLDAARFWINGATLELSIIDKMRRIYVVAQRR